MCSYQGYEFGANYPDSVCIDGSLQDADNCDGKGNIYLSEEDIPCPMCRKDDAVRWWIGQIQMRNEQKSYEERRKIARHLVADIRKNRKNGTEPWKKEAV